MLKTKTNIKEYVPPLVQEYELMYSLCAMFSAQDNSLGRMDNDSSSAWE